jgi:hypothetical protein
MKNKFNIDDKVKFHGPSGQYIIGTVYYVQPDEEFGYAYGLKIGLMCEELVEEDLEVA